IGIEPGFLETLRVALLAGRDIGPGDVQGRAAVALVNERYAARYFPHRSPLGQHLVSSLMGEAADLEIVGLVSDTTTGLRRSPLPIVYVSLGQFGRALSSQLVIRLNGPAAGVVEAIRAELQAQLPTTLVQLRPLRAQVSSSIVQERMMATLASGF